jgi:hypothetical protein
MKPSNHKFSRVERAIFTLQERLSSNTQVTGLKPNQTYYYVVKAKGKDGIIQWSEGAFSTSGRKVDVVIQNIHVIDDGDGGIDNPGDFIFQFKVMGYKYVVRTLMHSGSVNAVNKTISVAGVPPSLLIKLNLLEHDGTIAFKNMGDGLGEDYLGTYNVETSGGQETRNFILKAANGEYNVVISGVLKISYD